MEPGAKYTEQDMRNLLIACCAGIFVMPLMSTMMNLALVHIGLEFDVGSKDLALVNTTFLLSSVMVMVPLARISDIIGRKKIFVGGLFVTLISAGIAVFSPSFEILLVMRFAMGVGAAAISLSSIAMLTDVFPAEKRGWAIGVQSTFVYLGIAAGPALGGFICDLFGWRSLFIFMMPFALIGLILMSRFKKEITVEKTTKMDYAGSVVYAVTIFLSMYGVIHLPEPWAAGLVAIGLIMLVIFIRMQKRTKYPVLDVSIFKHKVFSRSCISAFMNYASSYSVSFFMALYLQSIGVLTASEAGLVLLVQPIVQIALTAKFGSLSDKIGDNRILPTLGMSITCVAVLMIIFLTVNVNYLYVAAILILLGLGYALFSAPNSSAIMSSVPPENRGDASGMISVVRQVGMMISMGIAMSCISFIMGSADNLNPDTYGQFIDVIRAAFTICLGMCIIGTLSSWFRGDSKTERAQIQ